MGENLTAEGVAIGHESPAVVFQSPLPIGGESHAVLRSLGWVLKQAATAILVYADGPVEVLVAAT